MGAILAALKITHSTPGEQRIVIYGGSTAGIGITDTIFRAVSQNGLSEAEARKLFLVIVDRTGLLTELNQISLPNFTTGPNGKYKTNNFNWHLRTWAYI